MKIKSVETLIFYSIVHFVLQIGENTQLDVAYRKSDRLRVEACKTNGVSQPLTGNICGTPFNIATVFRWFCTIHLLHFDKGKELLY